MVRKAEGKNLMLLNDLQTYVQVSEEPLVFGNKSNEYRGVCPFCLESLRGQVDEGFIKAECEEHGEINENMIVLRGKK